MECRCSRTALIKLVHSSLDVISDKNFLNVFSHLSITVSGSALTVHASDSIIHAQNTCEVEGIQDGSVAVHADRLSAVLRSIAGDTVHLVANATTLIVRPAPEKDTKTRFELRTITLSEDFHMPSFDEGIHCEIPIDTLQSIISKSIISVSNDESRFFLTGVYLTQEDGILHMIATDGKRLSVVQDTKTTLPKSFEGKIIPPKILRFLQRHAGSEGTASIAIGEQLLSITIDDRVTILAPHIEGQFPDYKRVIPSSQDQTLKIPRRDCIEAIKRAALFVETTNKILFHIKNSQIHIHAQDEHYGRAEAFVDVDYTGEEMLFAFNYKYLLEPFSVESSEYLLFQCSDVQKVVRLSADAQERVASFHIVMPMRITP